MKSDSELQNDVRDVLARQPDLRSDGIDVQVLDGVVTLTGEVRSDLERWNMRDAICSLPGVVSLTDEMMVKPEAPAQSPDPDIARPWFPAN